MENNISGTIENQVHRLKKRVYYSDTDAGGVVYHSRYIEMAEHARSELIHLLGAEQHSILTDEGIGVVVRSMNIQYNRPAFLDEVLTIESRITKCETFTLVFIQNICRDGEPLCEIELKAGSVSLKTGRPSPLPEDWKAKITGFMNPSASTGA
ncbi:MAG: YbgC/FadM family acyl-CoA thioesterase [Spirochaetales bacterium]|nr:YbgC/FadM family acyl-CoA thioesterase [Spirochaetales bacterium]